MTTFDERLDFAQDRVDHLSERVGALMRTRAPMRTVSEARVTLAGIDAGEAAHLNAGLLDQVPQRQVSDGETVLVLAAIARTAAVDVAVEVEAGGAELLPALAIGLDGAWADSGHVGEPDGRPVRRVRFGGRLDEGAGIHLCAVQLRLNAPGSVRVTRLVVEPAA
ncbi:hypothetical protein [Acuticoccus sediminis]|uniref:hypothetical protein n=1 Tax=Acuticoccus sediminis TaxID=2184697 RepID=UPI001CFE3F23|nr:hypothetical protein [Acuticoccus sediminis]